MSLLNENLKANWPWNWKRSPKVSNYVIQDSCQQRFDLIWFKALIYFELEQSSN